MGQQDESKVAAPVGGRSVLAVMDAACCVLAIEKERDPQRQLEQARAAVAELVEADKEYDSAREGYSDRTATPEQINRLARAELRRRAALLPFQPEAES